MFYTIISDFLKYLNNNFNGQIPNLIYFFSGLIGGIILFLITLLIVFIISKINSKRKTTITKIEENEEYKNIILANKDIYISIYKDAPLTEKLQGFGKIALSMLESISSLYYPNSNDSVFEISIEQLVDFLSYFSLRLNYLVDKILQEKLPTIDFFTSYSIKDKKISFVVDLLEKSKNNTVAINESDKKQKKGIFNFFKKKIVGAGKKIVLKYTTSLIDDQLIDLIEMFGNDINKLYSKQNLIFTDLTKKEKKKLKKKKGGVINA